MKRKDLNITVVSEESPRNLTVLRIASAAGNRVTQCYPGRVQVSFKALGDLNRKVIDKLGLHRIVDIHLAISMQFENDRTVSFDSLEALQRYDLNTGQCTYLVTMKWSFIFDVNGDGSEHMHSIYVRVSERPNAGLIFQKILSKSSEDIDSLDNDAFSPITCAIDFVDARFSAEILSVVNDWVLALPKAEPTFGFVNWLRTHSDRILPFVRGTLPFVAVLGYVGIWLGVLPEETSRSVRVATAWVLGGGAIFLISRYIAAELTKVFEKQLYKICNVPVFDITSGDSNKITKYMARSKRSVINLAAAGLTYGVFKVIGLYLATYVAKALFSF